ncbi:VOC family protein [Paraflavitalea speifideaquila]|uniref:VOC family protein n=1 Tax=Paraflavitalea speifideaquila TaxID=3076558 RepID=UPI0028E7E29A|nr:VOC family protein [Paraflavitalea speifideiaquila]
MPTQLATAGTIAANTDFLPLQGTDYVEFYVGNAKQAAHFYKTAFGFQSLAYAGPETGVKDRASYAIRQEKLTFVFTTPLRGGNAIADHIYKHGDGVKMLALRVEDATSAWEETTKRGARSYMEPLKMQDKDGEVVMSGIYTYGETVHLFIERKNTMDPLCQVSKPGPPDTIRLLPAYCM